MHSLSDSLCRRIQTNGQTTSRHFDYTQAKRGQTDQPHQTDTKKLNFRENESISITLKSGVRREPPKMSKVRCARNTSEANEREFLVNQSQKLTGITALLQGPLRFHLFHFCLPEKTMLLSS